MTTIENAARQALGPQPLAVERERDFCERCGKRLGGADHIHTCTPPQPAPQADIEQQPVAWISKQSLSSLQDFDATAYGRGGFDDATPLYTEPPKSNWQEIECPCCGELARAFPPAPKREWVGLNDEEIAQGFQESWVTEQAWQSAVWWAETKLKEKNA